jgi:phospholipase C
LPWLQRQPFIEGIYNARYREAPGNYKALSAAEIATINKDPFSSPLMARQEPGIKPSCALPYQLYADAHMGPDGKTVTIKMEARNEIFGAAAAGSPFNIFQPGKLLRSYAVAAGATLEDSFAVDGHWQLAVHGPNGFFREYKGSGQNAPLTIQCDYQRETANPNQLTGRLLLIIKNTSPSQTQHLTIVDHAYGNKPVEKSIAPGAETPVVIDTASSHGWYDLGITVKEEKEFQQHYSGRVETGKDSFTDPFMGRAS